MKEVAVLGLGDYGMALVKELTGNKVRVLAVDISRSRAEALKEVLDHVVIADITQEAALKELGLQRMDAVVVAVSDPMPTSILAVLRLRDLGVEHIIAKAENEDHVKVLRALGVEDIVIPELDSARRLANTISWTNVVELVSLSSDCAIMELAPPAAVVGKVLRDSGMREKYHVEVLAIRSHPGADLDAIPTPDRVISEECMLVVFGREKELAKLRKEAAQRKT